MNKLVVRKIRPSDLGYGTIQAYSWPWLMFFNTDQARGFSSWSAAMAYADRYAAKMKVGA